MLAKLTAKNQLTLPKAVLTSCPGAEYFEVTEDRGRVRGADPDAGGVPVTASGGASRVRGWPLP